MESKDLFQMLTDDEIVERYTNIVETLFADFPELSNRYEEAMKKLQHILGTEKVEDLINAHKRQIASDAVFAYSMGVKANLHHFKKPHAPSFLDVPDFGYIQEYVMLGMPKRMDAQKVIDNVLTLMSRETYEICYVPILEYICCFDTIVPKMAHYMGYTAANKILELTEPGYIQDVDLTFCYTNKIKDFFSSPV